jgi:hypothetical protein
MTNSDRPSDIQTHSIELYLHDTGAVFDRDVEYTDGAFCFAIPISQWRPRPDLTIADLDVRLSTNAGLSARIVTTEEYIRMAPGRAVYYGARRAPAFGGTVANLRAAITVHTAALHAPAEGRSPWRIESDARIDASAALRAAGELAALGVAEEDAS